MHCRARQQLQEEGRYKQKSCAITPRTPKEKKTQSVFINTHSSESSFSLFFIISFTGIRERRKCHRAPPCSCATTSTLPYSSAAPYFSKPVFASPASGAGAALPFASLQGRAAYDARVAALYAASARGWLTPVELFAPWYSYAIARCVLAAAPAEAPLRVYEVGGGTGAHARHFLDYVRAAAPARYARPGGVSYTILEISPQLCQRQGEALEAAGHARSVAASACVDAARAHEHLHDARPCTVVALEVLDNLPHDKVVCLDGALHETWVEEEEEEEEEEGEVEEGAVGGAQQQPKGALSRVNAHVSPEGATL